MDSKKLTFKTKTFRRFSSPNTVIPSMGKRFSIQNMVISPNEIDAGYQIIQNNQLLNHTDDINIKFT